MMANAETVELWTSAASNVVTAGALVIGGIWAYFRFFRQRTEKPRAKLSYTTAHRLLADDLLVRVAVRAENTGSVLIGVCAMRCEIQQVTPLAAETLAKLKARDLINPQNEADLRCIRCYEEEWNDGAVEIEPGEVESFDFDFVVPREIETILIYAHMPNAKRKDGGGWQASGFYDLGTALEKSRPADEQAGKEAA